MKKIVKWLCFIICIVLVCLSLVALGFKKWYDDKYGKLVLAYDVPKSEWPKYRYENSILEMTVTRVEQHGRGGYIAIVFMDIRNKTDEPQTITWFMASIIPAQYNAKLKRIKTLSDDLDYTLDKRAHPELSTPKSNGSVKPGETFKTYEFFVLDYPGQDLKYVTQENLFEDGPYTTLMSLKTKSIAQKWMSFS